MLEDKHSTYQRWRSKESLYPRSVSTTQALKWSDLARGRGWRGNSRSRSCCLPSLLNRTLPQRSQFLERGLTLLRQASTWKARGTPSLQFYFSSALIPKMQLLSSEALLAPFVWVTLHITLITANWPHSSYCIEPNRADQIPFTLNEFLVISNTLPLIRAFCSLFRENCHARSRERENTDREGGTVGFILHGVDILHLAF